MRTDGGMDTRMDACVKEWGTRASRSTRENMSVAIAMASYRNYSSDHSSPHLTQPTTFSLLHTARLYALSSPKLSYAPSLSNPNCVGPLPPGADASRASICPSATRPGSSLPPISVVQEALGALSKSDPPSCRLRPCGLASGGARLAAPEVVVMESSEPAEPKLSLPLPEPDPEVEPAAEL
jgi:hypothetical protein